jgi:hypothetical protein
MSKLLENITLGVQMKTYKWHVYQVDGFQGESGLPCAVFFHEEDATTLFNRLCIDYTMLRFVLTNVKTGESRVG